MSPRLMAILPLPRAERRVVAEQELIASSMFLPVLIRFVAFYIPLGASEAPFTLMSYHFLFFRFFLAASMRN